MDGDGHEKSVIEKMVDKINEAVENLVNTASKAAMKALEPETPKNAGQPIASLPLAGDSAGKIAKQAPKKSAANKTDSKSKKASKKSAGKATKKQTAKKQTTRTAARKSAQKARKRKARKSKR
jgi:hypothetical protein